MSRDIECPYCESWNEEPGECYSEDEPYEMECRDCEKRFVFSFGYLKVFDSHKAPCLNGEEHDYKPTIGSPDWVHAGKYRCTYCDKEKIVKAEKVAFLKRKLENLTADNEWERPMIRKHLHHWEKCCD